MGSDHDINAPSARTVLARHPIAVECAWSASKIADARAEVVVFEHSRVFVAASSDPDVLQPRSMTASENALVEAPSSGATALRVTHRSAMGCHSFAISNQCGETVAALTVRAELDEQGAAAVHAQARVLSIVIAEALTDGAATEAMTTALVHGLRDAVVVLDRDLNIMWANRSTGSLVGRSPADMIGRSAVEFIHPDDLEDTRNAIMRLVEGLELYRINVRIQRPEGTWENVQVTGNDHTNDPKVGGLVLSLRSADTDGEMAQSIERSERMADAIVAGLRDGIVATDQFGAITLVNEIARRMFGLELDAPAARFRLDDFGVIDTDQRRVMFAVNGNASPIPDPEAELRVESPNGGAQFVTLSQQPVIDARGIMLGTVLIFHDVTSTRRAAESLRKQALHDQLTGLPNRRQLEQRLTELATSDPSINVAACFIDLDGFKSVNDTHGHRTGDRLIQIAAQRLQRVLRRDDLLVRQGGDEFVVLQVDVSGLPEVLAVAERLRNALARPFTVNNGRFDVTASVGVAMASSEGLDGDALLRYADIALYAAKGRGRNRVEAFDRGLAEVVKAESRQRRFLREALSNNRLEMHFQPLVDTRDGKTVGYEALARVRTADGDIMSPSDFLPPSIPSDLMYSFDCAAFDQSCSAAAEIGLAHGVDGPFVSCNLSPTSLMQAGIASVMVETAARHHVDPSKICLEITESAAFSAGPGSLDSLISLHDSGFHLALDDFGTGYSSLAHLRDLPIDTVKVDRSFIARLPEHGPERAITAAIVTLANELGIRAIAEGVENADLLEYTNELGFDYAQGWHFSKAQPLAEVLAAEAGR